MTGAKIHHKSFCLRVGSWKGVFPLPTPSVAGMDRVRYLAFCSTPAAKEKNWSEIMVKVRGCNSPVALKKVLLIGQS